MKTFIYQGELYNLIHKYKSGYCEIRKVQEKNNNNIILVNGAELEEVKTEVVKTEKEKSK